jgi:hypothetical protein
VQIYSDANIFLLSSLEIGGVTNMVPVRMAFDPEGQGADGLDFLEPLFQKFLPASGDSRDERATVSTFFRQVQRRSILGRRFISNRNCVRCRGHVQQFNRSPPGQSPGERKLHKLAIPLEALGGVRPGEVIKLGAVVGLAGFDTNLTRQTRELDTALLGSALSGSGQESVLLEGLPVKLAIHPDDDEDLDFLSNSQETGAGTDLFNPDTDGDSLLDGWEVRHALNPLSASRRTEPTAILMETASPTRANSCWEPIPGQNIRRAFGHRADWPWPFPLFVGDRDWQEIRAGIYGTIAERVL